MLTADNGASYEDNGIGLYRWKMTAAADIDDDAIGGSISLACRSNNNQQTTGVRRWRQQYNDRQGIGEERNNNQP